MPMRTSSNPALYTFDAAKRAEYGNICGVDEAGRGPLCGPVCVAAVILNPDDPIEGVNDSKKLSEKRREALFDEIIARALCYQIVFISPQEIDERNILWATMDGMEQAVAGLAVTPDYVLVDGNRCPPNLAQPAEAVVKGDANSASIAAASISQSRSRTVTQLSPAFSASPTVSKSTVMQNGVPTSSSRRYRLPMEPVSSKSIIHSFASSS